MSEVLVAVLRWWLATTLVGALALPLAWRLFAALPGRGLAFARPLGLLIAGYVWWIGAMAGVLPSRALGAWLAVALLGAAGAAVAWPARARLRAEIRARRRRLVGLELLYAAALLGWALYRAFAPDVTQAGGEKTMEMAFLSAVLQSPRFPPGDPWMSGFGISYYYFGYVIAGLVVHLAGVSRFVAFNLVVPMTLGMTLAGAFDLGHALASLTPGASRAVRVGTGALTATALAGLGNFSGALEVAYRAGWLPPAFFRWLDVRDLGAGAGVCGGTDAPYDVLGALPGPLRATDYLPDRFLWWWRGSRIIHDGCGEVIHEFPFFSFMLADVHPHVMALPYVLLVLALALMVLAGGLPELPGRPPLSPAWLALPLAVGALAFLNTWDMPAYGFVVAAAFVLWRTSPGRASEDEPPARRARDVAAFVGWLVALALALYLPFHLGFRSQADGFGVSAFSSRPGQWLVHFGVLAALGASTVALTAAALPARRALAVSLVAVAAALAVMAAAPLVAPRTVAIVAVVAVAAAYLAIGRAGRALGPATRVWLLAGVTVAVAVVARWTRVHWDAAGGVFGTWSPWTPAALAWAVGAAGAVLLEGWFRGRPSPPAAPPAAGIGDGDARVVAAAPSPEAPGGLAAARPVAATFALLCVGTGLLLAVGTEFVFIRDLFNNRMNTVFKLFYQAWVLLAVGGGYAACLAWTRLGRRGAAAWSVGVGALCALALVYPVGAVWDRTDGLRLARLAAPVDQGGGWRAWLGSLTLDGLAYWRDAYPDDLAAAAWLDAHAPRGAHILEATGGSYSHAGRIAMATGRPTVLGPDWHETQWRGDAALVAPRKADVEAFYGGTMGADAMRAFLDRHEVRYVVVGELEHEQYDPPPAVEERLGELARVVFAQGRTRIYARR